MVIFMTVFVILLFLIRDYWYSFAGIIICCMFLFHRFLLVLLLLFNVAGLYAQENKLPKVALKGVVISADDNAPLPGATVILQRDDSTVLNTTITSDSGSFTFEVPAKNNYIIRVRYIRFNDYLSGPVNVSGEAVDLGRISLSQTGKLLEGVTITANRKKKLIEIREDRIIYNAGSDISNKAGTAADVLRKAPMLTVEASGEVKMRGNANIKVLLNGMPSAIMAKNLKEALKTIPASSIVSIEVINNPSAKYEAEGAAGVINIITKKKMKGTSGNLDLSVGNLEQSGDLGLNIATGKFNFSFMLNMSHEKERNTSVSERNSLANGKIIGNLLQEMDAKRSSRGGYGSFTTEYRVDSLQKIEAGISFWKGNWPEKSDLHSRYRSNTENTEYTQKSDQGGSFSSYELSLNYQKKFTRKGQELQFIGQASRSDDKSAYITDQYLMNGTHAFREESPNIGSSTDWSLQTDYSHPLNKSGKSTIETGVRYLGNNAKSDYKVFNSLNPADTSRSNVMSYFQEIFSAYVSINLRTANGWGFRPGLRYENTRLGGDFTNNTSSFRSGYSNWVPGLLITKKFNDEQEMKLNYTERIRRPWIWDLNPYVNASDPKNITAGNPYLKPELTRMFELGYAYSAAFGFSLNSSIYFNTNSNAIESIATVDTAGVSYTTSQNIAANSRLGMNIDISLPLNAQWNLNAGAELFYQKFKSKTLNLQHYGNFYTFRLNSTYELPKDISLLISGDYGNGYITLQGTNSANYSYRIAVQKEIFDKKASLTLSANNLFQNNLMQKSTATAPTFQSNTTSWFYNRSVSLSFSWRFGGLHSTEKSENRFSGQDAGKPAHRGKQ